MIILKIKRRILWFLFIRIVHILFQPPRGGSGIKPNADNWWHGEILFSGKGAIADRVGEVDKPLNFSDMICFLGKEYNWSSRGFWPMIKCDFQRVGSMSSTENYFISPIVIRVNASTIKSFQTSLWVHCSLVRTAPQSSIEMSQIFPAIGKSTRLGLKIASFQSFLQTSLN